ncbi:THG1 [Auxenochlorella protothecoides x Auxenochlorella symbiontica]
MAKSAYEYVRTFEQDDRLLPGCWIVLRVDGKGFTRFCEEHKLEKPNDGRALALMDASAEAVMLAFPDVRLAFGESDEYSFVLPPSTKLYGRRASKLVSLVVSCFTATYVRRWAEFLPGTPLLSTPMFDGRAVCYPNLAVLRDYLSWRQVDTHINNLYNACFWALVKGGMDQAAAHERLKGTLSSHKNELLFSEYGINYNEIPARFRKGSTLIRQRAEVRVKKPDGSWGVREKWVLQVLHVDIIGNQFWEEHPHLVEP